jgi:hypothetical protein
LCRWAPHPRHSCRGARHRGCDTGCSAGGMRRSGRGTRLSAANGSRRIPCGGSGDRLRGHRAPRTRRKGPRTRSGNAPTRHSGPGKSHKDPRASRWGPSKIHKRPRTSRWNLCKSHKDPRTGHKTRGSSHKTRSTSHSYQRTRRSSAGTSHSYLDTRRSYLGSRRSYTRKSHSYRSTGVSSPGTSRSNPRTSDPYLGTRDPYFGTCDPSRGVSDAALVRRRSYRVGCVSCGGPGGADRGGRCRSAGRRDPDSDSGDSSLAILDADAGRDARGGGRRGPRCAAADGTGGRSRGAAGLRDALQGTMSQVGGEGFAALGAPGGRGPVRRLGFPGGGSG